MHGQLGLLPLEESKAVRQGYGHGGTAGQGLRRLCMSKTVGSREAVDTLLNQVSKRTPLLEDILTIDTDPPPSSVPSSGLILTSKVWMAGEGGPLRRHSSTLSYER
jgi:hypothetical protein